MSETMTIYELSVGDDGQIIVPLDLRTALGLQAGETIIAVQDADGLLLIPGRLRVPEFADKLSEAMARQGLTLVDLVADGESIRQALFEERYGDLAE